MSSLPRDSPLSQDNSHEEVRVSIEGHHERDDEDDEESRVSLKCKRSSSIETSSTQTSFAQTLFTQTSSSTTTALESVSSEESDDVSLSDSWSSSPTPTPSWESVASEEHLDAPDQSEHGIRVRDVCGLEYVHPLVEPFLAVMYDISRGRGILPRSMQTEFLPRDAQTEYLKLARKFPRFALPSTDETYYDSPHNLTNRTPSVWEIAKIMLEARCQTSPIQMSWKSTVQNTLKLALRSRCQGSNKHLIDVMACSPSVHCEYAPTSSPNGGVDFCVYIKPNADPTFRCTCPKSIHCASQAVQRARRRLPDHAINHTTYRPLRKRVVAFGIQTMVAGEDWDSALSRLRFWQTAHWNFMQYLEVLSPAADQNTVADIEEQGESSRSFADLVSFPPLLLPGIIVKDHDWYLIVSTLAGKKVESANRIKIGTTENTTGVYQIIRCLQALGNWAEFLYWPGMKSMILKVSQSPQVGANKDCKETETRSG